jgi:predicted phage replisome organizer
MADVQWIKIATQIFDNRKIKQIEKMPEGDAIIVVWFKLLCLAGTCNKNGMIYLTDEIPYTEDMLAAEFRMEQRINVLKLALKIFEHFKMIEIIDDVFNISSWDKYQNIEGLEKIREQNRIRQARYKENQKLLQDNVTNNVIGNAEVTQSNATDKEIELDKDIDKEKNKKKDLLFFPNDEKLNQTFLDFIDMRKSIKAKMTDRAITLMINKINKLDAETAIKMLEQSIMNSWKDIYSLKEDKQTQPSKQQSKRNQFNQFPQREYTSQDFTETEKKLINRGFG